MTDQAERHRLDKLHDKELDDILCGLANWGNLWPDHKEGPYIYGNGKQISKVDAKIAIEDLIKRCIAEAHKGYVQRPVPQSIRAELDEARKERNTPILYERDGSWYLYLPGPEDSLGQHYDSSNVKMETGFGEALANWHQADVDRAVLEAQIMSLEAVKYASPEEIDARIADKRKALPPHNPTQVTDKNVANPARETK